LKENARSDEARGIGDDLTTPASVQKLQMALHVKPKRMNPAGFKQSGSRSLS
jgi:hypothetical protein